VEAIDARLLARLAGDDVDALDATLARFWSPLVRYLIGLLHSREAAEDIAQETFFRLWERRAGLRLDGSLRGFLYQVARNLAISEQRRTRTSERTASALLHEQLPFASIELPDDHLELQRAVTALPERRREILLLHSVHGLSCKEIGRLLGIAPQTVANQYSAALATLRQALPSRPMV
jgi:RNA polymerase sigma-70 factor (ECF subfamily)